MVAWRVQDQCHSKPVAGWQNDKPLSGSLEKRFTEDPEQSDVPLCEDDMDIVIGASGTTTTTSAAPMHRTG